MTSRKHKTVPKEVDTRQYYDEFYRQGDFIHYPESVDLSFFHAIFMYFSIPYNATILDGGCGTGIRMKRMQKLSMDVVGIDLSIAGLDKLRTEDADAKIVQGSLLQMPFPAGTFDAVIALGCSLINTEDAITDRAMIRESLRVVKTGGWVVATTVTDFSGGCPSGWLYREKGSVRSLVTDVESAESRVIYTAPGLVAKMPKLMLNTIGSRFVELLPRFKRTVVMGWRK